MVKVGGEHGKLFEPEILAGYLPALLRALSTRRRSPFAVS